MYIDVNILSEPDFSGKKILIAEDDAVNFKLYDIILRRTGAEVYHAWNGRQVVEMVRQHNDISLVLMDIKMPLMNGLHAAIEVRKINPNIKIVAQTAYIQSDEINLCYEAGCIEYLEKPIQKKTLFNILEKHI